MFKQSWSEIVTGKKPWYKKARVYFYAGLVFASFQAGAYYNATRIMDSALPHDVYEPRQLDGGWNE